MKKRVLEFQAYWLAANSFNGRTVGGGTLDGVRQLLQASNEKRD